MHPNSVFLTYRPVKYYASSGALREGVCTSYLAGVVPGQSVTAALRSNPQFRLPLPSEEAPPPPMLLLAGGCGVAPIRAFLEELVWNARQQPDNKKKSYGPVHLFLGFRHPDDAVYMELVETAKELGVLAPVVAANHLHDGLRRCAVFARVGRAPAAGPHRVRPAHAAGGRHVRVRRGADLWGGHSECGAGDSAARWWWDADGRMDETAATTFLQELVRSGRYHEDLSD